MDGQTAKAVFLATTTTTIVMMMMMAMMGPTSVSAVTCPEVEQYVKPCIRYLAGGGDLSPCCGGVSVLNGVAQSTPDRRFVCYCLKDIGKKYPFAVGKAAGIPGLCGLTVPYYAGPNGDCMAVN
ncbi:hypothetical protein M569_07881 [Genlisea aurea]|uniref:Non-specific lipid-transfer protein n=1 Tax=Genlisea aurea TaxID=192259 RepID=S8E3S1_9LAMI|nr:hypothetical protein M569_07881 [Genlisea aurea]